MSGYYTSENAVFSNSIEHRESGKILETLVLPAILEELKNLPGNWLFDWAKESTRHPVFKLTTVAEPNQIQGLMSVEEQKGFIFVPLIENAPFNRSKERKYRGVAGNLFAFACKLSSERGHEGFVAFDAKTALKEHYRKTLGAQAVGNSLRMFIDEVQAQKLITFHFPK